MSGDQQDREDDIRRRSAPYDRAFGKGWDHAAHVAGGLVSRWGRGERRADLDIPFRPGVPERTESGAYPGGKEKNTPADGGSHALSERERDTLRQGIQHPLALSEVQIAALEITTKRNIIEIRRLERALGEKPPTLEQMVKLDAKVRAKLEKEYVRYCRQLAQNALDRAANKYRAPGAPEVAETEVTKPDWLPAINALDKEELDRVIGQWMAPPDNRPIPLIMARDIRRTGPAISRAHMQAALEKIYMPFEKPGVENPLGDRPDAGKAIVEAVQEFRRRVFNELAEKGFIPSRDQ